MKLVQRWSNRRAERWQFTDLLKGCDPAAISGELLKATSAVRYLGCMSDVTHILSEIEQGDAKAADKLLPLVYEELRKLAAAKLAQEKPGQTLQATALVHEAYVRLVDVEQAGHWDSRAHFFSAAAESMRQILVNNAVRKNRPKHGGDRQRVELDSRVSSSDSSVDELVEVSDALDRLSQVDREAAELVKLKYFAGLPLPEIACVLGISQRTADRRWAYARAWLHQELAVRNDAPEGANITTERKI